MPTAVVAGGGLAGMAAAVALVEAGFEVRLFEARATLGGRASSFVPPGGAELIDNGQHILLGCCTNLLDFYARLGVRDLIRFDAEYRFVERGGRVSRLRPGRLPRPLRLLGSLLRLPFLSAADKAGLLRALRALRRDSGRRDLDDITMADWLSQQRQTPAALRRFWRPVLVAAINEELDRMAASHAFQVFRLAFLGPRRAWELGVPTVPLCRLYRLTGVSVHLRAPIERVLVRDGAAEGVMVNGEPHRADHVVLAVPVERVPVLAPELDLNVSPFEFAPITGIHLWFDRPVMDLPHAALLEGAVHWVFNKDRGRYLLGVTSASRALAGMSREDAIVLALRELEDYFPAARGARPERAQVVNELRATFSARPGLEAHRPPAETRIRHLYLAGDWTRTGWPATMEGAVRSGYLAAEAVARAAGAPRRFLVPAS
ncbi:MAG: FAD-binding protein [Acidobacteria bacterium]|nr:FAD-binding protein [Acidobacteriota bacterium]